MSEHHHPEVAEKALRALRFAQAHDWGARAFLYTDSEGVFYVGGIVERWTWRKADGSVEAGQDVVCVRATPRAVREFGGY